MSKSKTDRELSTMKSHARSIVAASSNSMTRPETTRTGSVADNNFGQLPGLSDGQTQTMIGPSLDVKS